MNPTLDTVEKIEHFVVYELAVEGAILAVSTYLPFLKIPVISTMFRIVVFKFTNILYAELNKLSIFGVINIQVDRENSQYKEAKEELKTVIDTGVRNEINTASKLFKEKLRALIRLNP